MIGRKHFCASCANVIKKEVKLELKLIKNESKLNKEKIKLANKKNRAIKNSPKFKKYTESKEREIPGKRARAYKAQVTKDLNALLGITLTSQDYKDLERTCGLCGNVVYLEDYDVIRNICMKCSRLHKKEISAQVKREAELERRKLRGEDNTRKKRELKEDFYDHPLGEDIIYC